MSEPERVRRHFFVLQRVNNQGERMRHGQVPTEVIASISLQLGIIDFSSLHRLWKLLDVFFPEIFLELLATTHDLMADIIKTGDPRYFEYALRNGGQIENRHRLLFLHPYRRDVITIISYNPEGTFGTLFSWVDVLHEI